MRNPGRRRSWSRPVIETCCRCRSAGQIGSKIYSECIAIPLVCTVANAGTATCQNTSLCSMIQASRQQAAGSALCLSIMDHHCHRCDRLKHTVGIGFFILLDESDVQLNVSFFHKSIRGEDSGNVSRIVCRFLGDSNAQSRYR